MLGWICALALTEGRPIEEPSGVDDRRRNHESPSLPDPVCPSFPAARTATNERPVASRIILSHGAIRLRRAHPTGNQIPLPTTFPSTTEGESCAQERAGAQPIPEGYGGDPRTGRCAEMAAPEVRGDSI